MSNPTQVPKSLPKPENEDAADGEFLVHFAHVYSNWIPKVSDRDRITQIGERLIEKARDNTVALSLNIDTSALEQPGAMEGFAKWASIQREKTQQRAVPIPRGPDDLSTSQDVIDRVDATDLGVSLDTVIKAREMYQAEMACTRLYFMAEWNSVARFKKREYVRRAQAE